MPLDGVAFGNRLGPPLEQEFARYGLDVRTTATLVARFRELYQEIVIPVTVPLPGRDGGAAGGGRARRRRRRGDRQVRAERAWPTSQALRCRRRRAVVGQLWAGGKAVALREHRAEVYVGDHTGDVVAAREADAMAVAVATGPIAAGGADRGRRRRGAAGPHRVPGLAGLLPAGHRPLTATGRGQASRVVPASPARPGPGHRRGPRGPRRPGRRPSPSGRQHAGHVQPDRQVAGAGGEQDQVATMASRPTANSTMPTFVHGLALGPRRPPPLGAGDVGVLGSVGSAGLTTDQRNRCRAAVSRTVTLERRG